VCVYTHARARTHTHTHASIGANDNGANDRGTAEREPERAGEERGDSAAGASHGCREGGGNGVAEAEEEVLHNPVLAHFPSVCGSAADATSGEAGGYGEGVGSGRAEEGSRAARTPLNHELLCHELLGSRGGGGGMEDKAPQSLYSQKSFYSEFYILSILGY
jgi:hypothetical protein